MRLKQIAIQLYVVIILIKKYLVYSCLYVVLTVILEL